MPLLHVIVAVSLAVLGIGSSSREEARPLFNGKDLGGWVAEGQAIRKGDLATPVWTVEDGKLVCNGEGFGFLRYTCEEFGDFSLHVEFRMATKCNSGLGIRTRAFDPTKSGPTRPSNYSYEIQLLDDAGMPPSKHSTGSLYRYVAPTANTINPATEWNSMDVTCNGPRITITLNGAEIVDIDQTTIDALKSKPLKGYVCLQNHGGKIEFREIRIREISSQLPKP